MGLCSRCEGRCALVRRVVPPVRVLQSCCVFFSFFFSLLFSALEALA